MNRSTAPAEVELVLFEVGGVRFGAASSAVRRIDRRHPEAPAAVALGRAAAARRALVVQSADGEVQVPVDAVVGVRRVARSRLRPLPAFAAGLVAPGVVGVLLDETGPVPLIALEALVDGEPCAAAPRLSGAVWRGR